MSPHALDCAVGTVEQGKPLIVKPRLEAFESISRFLPVDNEDHAFWWKLTGRHVARMMLEAEYPQSRQVECLLFHRFVIIPRLGPRPTSSTPSFKSRVAAGAGDGSSIGYSWRWGVGDDAKPYIRNYIEPMGTLTGTSADPCNEVATKELLWDLSKVFPEVDLTLFWKFAPHLSPHLMDETTRQKYAGSALLVGLEMAPESGSIDIKSYMYPRVPAQISDLLHITIPNAMRDAYGEGVSLDSLHLVRDFLASDPHGSQLMPAGTTAIDCCRPQDARVKVYAMTRNTSFDHIAAILTLNGQKPASEDTISQLRELWYGLKGLEPDFPTSAQLPAPDEGNGATSSTNPNGVSFYFDIQPRQSLPDVKAYFDVGKHAKSDMAAAQVVTDFLQRHGRGRYAQSYLNVLQDIVPADELQTKRGTQAYFSVAFKKGELDITSYFIPQAYRRFDEIKAELSDGKMQRQRRSRFQ